MVISIISLVVGIASLLYFAGYVIWNGINNSFLYFWMFLGISGIAYPALHRMILQRGAVFWRRAEQIALGAILICTVIIIGIVGILVSEGKEEPSANADYVIVLGAHVFGERMSANLRYRVEAAYGYLKKNPDTKVVLSGGQGQGEEITEAEAMRRYLVQEGIEEDRILIEGDSVNTEENIKNSAELIGDKSKKVVIVSNSFHIYRAKGIAKKQGYTDVEGLGCKIHPYSIPNAYVREAVAVIKYKICRQI